MTTANQENGAPANVIRRHWLAIAICGAILLYGAFMAAKKPMWLDEIATYLIATSESMDQTWHLLATGPQTDPPLFYVASRTSMALLGQNPLGFRLPSVLGTIVFSLCIYVFMARRMAPEFAALAMILVLLPPVTRYIYEGRPYGLWLGWSGLTLLSWQSAAGASGLRKWLCLISLAIFSATSVATHFYAVVFLSALGLAEAYRQWTVRRISPATWTAMAAGGVPLVFLKPLIDHGKLFIANSWARPAWNGALLIYRDFLHGWTPFVLFCMGVFIASGLFRLAFRSRPQNSGRRKGNVPMPEIVAASVIACLPCFAFLLARFYTNNLQLRYVIPTVSGLAVLVCAVAQSLGGGRAWVGRLLVCCLCALLAYECLPQVWQYARSNAARSRDFTVIEEGSRRALQAGALLTTTSPGVLVETQFYHPEIPVVYLCGFRSQDNYDEITRHARVWFNVLERQELAQHDCYVIVPKITGHEVLDWFIAHAHDGWQVVSGAPLESGENVYLAKRNKIAIGVAN